MTLISMKSLTAAAAALALLGVTGAAQATRYARWFDNGAFIGTLSFDGRSVSVPETMTAVMKSGGPLGALNTSLDNFTGKLASDLNDRMAKEASSEAGVTFNGGNLGGPINLGISAQSGLLQVAFSGPSYSASVSGRRSWNGLSVSCTTDIRLNAIAFTFLYNPVNGTIQQVTQAQLNPTQNTSCSSSLSWIPVVGGFIDRYAANRVGGAAIEIANNAAAQISDKDNFGKLQLFGLTNAIKPGQYVFDGVDYGSYIVNNFSYLLNTSAGINMTINPQIKESDYTHSPGSAMLHYTPFSFNFFNQNHSFGFTLSERISYTEQELCDTTKPECTDPK